MFRTILMAAATLLHAYVFLRAASVPSVNRLVPRRILLGTGAILWACVMGYRFLGHGGDGDLAAVLEAIVMSWLASLFLVSVCLIAADLVTGFGLLLPRWAPTLRGLALVAGGLLSAIALVQGLRSPVVEEYEVPLPGLSDAGDGTVIVAMSDMHLGSTLGSRWLEARVDQVRSLRPDLVVLLGDLFEGHGSLRREFIPVLASLTAPQGVFAVPGNHESHGGMGNGMSLLEEAGIRVLRNRWAEVRPGLVLAGVDDLTSALRAGGDVAPFARAVAGRPPGACVLLSHTPWQAGKAAGAGAGLMLSGHTHGGQVWPFGYLVRFRYPLLDGAYEVDGMKVIVCRGTGAWGTRMRLWRPAQILRITLRTAGPPRRGSASSARRGLLPLRETRLDRMQVKGGP